MKVLFIVQDIDYHSPIGIMQVGAMAKQRDAETHLAILSRENVFHKISALKPEIIAYGGSTGEHKYYTKINRKIKEKHPEIFTIMGGPHATFFPEVLKEANLDAVCIGEGEFAFSDILDRIENGKEVSGIENVITCPGQKVTLRPLIQDLDSLPFPDRPLFFDSTENGQAPVKHFMTSRGCPYECSYCFNKSFRDMYKGQKYVRRHSVDYVIEEILQTKSNYPIRYVKFYDDIFCYKADEWLEEFVKKYSVKINLPFYCLTRPDLMTDEIAGLLKEANCKTVQMAVESTNDRIREKLLNRNITKEQMVKAFRTCTDKGIAVVTNYILGLPTSTIKDDIDSVYFNVKAGVHVPEFPIFQPYPKTVLGERCLREGWFRENFEDIHVSYNNISPLNCFSRRNKNIQRNINRLGQIAASYTLLTELIMKRLIYLPHNILFAKAYSLFKLILYEKYVYPIRHSLKDKLVLISKTLRLETFKRVTEKRRKLQ